MRFRWRSRGRDRVLIRVPVLDPRGVVAGLLDRLRPARRPLPRGGTEMRLRAALREPGCPICRVTRGSDESWIFWFLHESHMEPEVLDQLTVSAGFCPAHGERLLREPSARTQIATVHRIVVQRLRARWRSERGFAAWAARIVRADGRIGPCPACRARDQAVRDAGVLLAQLLEAEQAASYGAAPARLCLVHLRLVARHLGRASLERVLQAQETAFEQAAVSVDPTDVALVARHHPDTLPLPHSGQEEAGRLADPVRMLERDIGSSAGCPICLEVRRAWGERLSWLHAEAARDEGGLHDLLPTCSEHVFATLDAAGAELARATRARAIGTALERMRQALHVLRETGPQAHRQGLRDLLATLGAGRNGSARRAIDALTRGLDCPACTRLAAARDRTLFLLFALLEQRHQRTAFERGHGLCVRHFARALALPPAPAVRACLREAMMAKLAVLEWELTEYARKSAWLARAEPTGTERLAPERAVHRCSGSLAAPTAPEPSTDG